MTDRGEPNGALYVTTASIPRTPMTELRRYRLECMCDGGGAEWTLYLLNPPEGGRERLVATSVELTDGRKGLLLDIDGIVIHNSLNGVVDTKKADWIVVPAEPTERMLITGSKAEVGVLEHIDGEILRQQGKMKLKTSKVVLGGEQLVRVWKAMLKGYTG